MRSIMIIVLAAGLISCAPMTQRITVDDAAQKAEARKQTELALQALIDGLGGQGE